MMTAQPDEIETERAVAVLIESYRQGFLHLNPEQLASIWDSQHNPLIYVAQEKEEPIYGWPPIQRYFAALPEHLDEILAKHLEDVQIDVLGDTAIAFFTSHSSVKLKALYEVRADRPRHFHLPANSGGLARYPLSRILSLRAGRRANRAGETMKRLTIQILVGSIREGRKSLAIAPVGQKLLRTAGRVSD